MSLEMIIGMAAAAIIEAVKDKATKKKIRLVALKIFTTLKTAYAGDKAFQ